MDCGLSFCMFECTESSQQPCEVDSILFTEEETELERLTPKLYIASKWQSRVLIQAIWLRSPHSYHSCFWVEKHRLHFMWGSIHFSQKTNEVYAF